MVRFQVIDLLPEYQNPQILTQEFDHIQCVRKAWPVSRESVRNRQPQSLPVCLSLVALGFLSFPFTVLTPGFFRLRPAVMYAPFN